MKTHNVLNSDSYVGMIEYVSGEYEFVSESGELAEYSCWSTESEHQSEAIRQLEDFIDSLEKQGYLVEVL